MTTTFKVKKASKPVEETETVLVETTIESPKVVLDNNADTASSVLPSGKKKDKKKGKRIKLLSGLGIGHTFLGGVASDMADDLSLPYTDMIARVGQSVDYTASLLGYLRSVSPDAVLQSCPAGYFVQVLLWEKGTSEAEAKTSSWLHISGIWPEPVQALIDALTSPPLAKLYGGTLPMLRVPTSEEVTANVEPRKAAKGKVLDGYDTEELISELWGRLTPDMGPDDFEQYIKVLSEPTVQKMANVTLTVDEGLQSAFTKLDQSNSLREGLDLPNFLDSVKSWAMGELNFVMNKAYGKDQNEKADDTKSLPEKFEMSSEEERLEKAVQDLELVAVDKAPWSSPEEKEEFVQSLIGKQVTAQRALHTGGNRVDPIITGEFVEPIVDGTKVTYRLKRQVNRKWKSTAILLDTAKLATGDEKPEEE